MNDTSIETSILSPERMTLPSDLARAAKLGTLVERPMPTVEVEAKLVEHKAGDVIEREGKQFMLVPELHYVDMYVDRQRVSVQIPYTLRQYYSHTFEETPPAKGCGNGPGWDSKFRLMDPDIAKAIHDREFNEAELADLPSNLPESDCLFVSAMDSERVEEYLDNTHQHAQGD